jgi:hypothetical protein
MSIALVHVRMGKSSRYTYMHAPVQWNNNVVKELYLQSWNVGLVTIH